MMKQLALYIFLCCSSITAAMAGEINVLLSFDSAGHKVVLVRHIASTSKHPSKISEAKEADKIEIEDMDMLINTLQPSVATLVWKDDQGTWQSRTQEPDPRVTRSPGHIDGVSAGQFSEREGAWLVSGPDTATSLTILLPADIGLGLGFEQWDVSVKTRY